MEGEIESSAGVREAWRGAWRVVLVRGPIVVGAQGGFCGLVFGLLCLKGSVPEWFFTVLMFVLAFPLIVLMVVVFYVFPFTIETRVIGLIGEVMGRRRSVGADVFERVKRFGGLSSVFFVFVPVVVFVVFEVFIF